MAAITYHELSNYSNNILLTKTFETAFATTFEEHKEEVKGWLEELTEETGRLCEEVIICDFEDIPTHYVGEFDLSPEYFLMLKLMNKNGLDVEVYEAGLAMGVSLHLIAESYQGVYESDTDFAVGLVEQSGLLEGVSIFLARYFDYVRYANDLMCEGYCSHDKHYFAP